MNKRITLPFYYRDGCSCGKDGNYIDAIVTANDKVEAGIKEEYMLVSRAQNSAAVERTRQLEEHVRASKRATIRTKPFF